MKQARRTNEQARLAMRPELKRASGALGDRGQRESGRPLAPAGRNSRTQSRL